MASRSELVPVKVRTEVRTKWTSTTARKPVREAPSIKSGLTNIKSGAVQTGRPALSARVGLTNIKSGAVQTGRPALSARVGLTNIKSGAVQTGRPALSARVGLTNIKSGAVLVKPAASPRQKLMSKNVIPVVNRALNKPAVAATNKVNMRKSHAGFSTVDRSLPKHTTPSRRSVVTGPRTPKSILKREPYMDKKSAQASLKKSATCPDSHHVKFKSKATEQEVMRAKLKAWLEAKGKTQSACKYRHHNCHDTCAKKTSEVLVDRRITQNGLSQQMKVLNNEAVKKNLFKFERKSLSQADKENSTQAVELTLKDDVDRNENVAVKEADNETTESGAGHTLLAPLDVAASGNVAEGDVYSKIQAMLAECLGIFNSGCSLENVLPWFAELEVTMPEVRMYANYYVCRAKLVAAFPQKVLDVYCEAVRNNTQPSELIATEMKNYLSKYLPPVIEVNKTRTSDGEAESEPDSETDSETDPLESLEPLLQSRERTSHSMTPREAGDKKKLTGHHLGSTIKFTIENAKPFIRQFMGMPDATFMTPVRRSFRLSGKPATPSTWLRKEVNSVSDLSTAELQVMLFKENPAVPVD